MTSEKRQLERRGRKKFMAWSYLIFLMMQVICFFFFLNEQLVHRRDSIETCHYDGQEHGSLNDDKDTQSSSKWEVASGGGGRGDE